ncbi:MAG: acyl carrier protein [Clostridia bacterium]
MDVFEKLKAMILDFLEINEDVITPEITWEEMGVDSVDLVEFIMEIETQFDIEVSDEALEDLKTLQDVVDYIEHEA